MGTRSGGPQRNSFPAPNEDLCAYPGSSLSCTLGSSRVPALYQKLAMERESQSFNSGVAKDALPGGSLVYFCRVYVCQLG